MTQDMTNEEKALHYAQMAKSMKGEGESGKNFIVDALENWEPLLPELKTGLYKNEFLGTTSINSPLVIDVFYQEQLNYLYNQTYRTKERELANSVEKKDWSRYVFFHERPYRFEALYQLWSDYQIDKNHPEQFWKLFGETWVDTENMWQVEVCVEEILANANRQGIKSIMDENEWKLFESLPNIITIYRGVAESGRYDGLSWSLSYWKARWFAKRFSKGEGKVVSLQVPKEHILGCFMNRQEAEIAIDPTKCEIVNWKLVRVSNRPTFVKKLFKKVKREFKLQSNSHHGPWHWEKVERNALKIARNTTGADQLVCQLFAILHDSQRENEYEDPDHGKRAAEYVANLYDKGSLDITKEQFEKLVFACERHEKGETSTDPTIGTCWDADRQDLIRVGTIPNLDLFSTKAGKSLLWKT